VKGEGEGYVRGGGGGEGDAACEEAVPDAGEEGGVGGLFGSLRKKRDEGLRGGVDGMDLGC